MNTRNKWKDYAFCEKEIIKNPKNITLINTKDNEKLYKIAIFENPLLLQHVPFKYQTFDLCKITVDKNEESFKYIINNEIRNQILSWNGLLIKYIKYPTLNECLIAIEENEKSFNYIDKNILLENDYIKILSINGLLLKYIPTEKRTFKILTHAISKNADSIQYIDNPNYEFCLQAIEKDGYTLKYIQHKTHEICLLAVKICPDALQYVENQTYEIAKIAIEQDGETIRFLDNNLFCNELIEIAIKNTVYSLQYIPSKYRTFELCYYAVKKNFYCLMDLLENEQTEEICKIALDQNNGSFQYIKKLTYPICLYAIKLYPILISCIPSQFHSIEICNIIYNYSKSLWIHLKNEEFLIKNNLVQIQYTYENNIICPICDNEVEYYTRYSCHKKHIVCLKCRENKCYYRCNSGTPYFNFLLKNIKI